MPDADKITYENTGQVVDVEEEQTPVFHEPSESEKELTAFVIEHCDKWKEYRDQNFADDWDKYERIFRGKWSEDEKTRQSERSRVISPATQQAVETRHAEVMEAIFGQGEFFDIKDDVKDQNGQIDVESLKKQLYEDFSQDKVRKSVDQIVLLSEIYGTGIGEITVSVKKQYKPMQVPVGPGQMAYGTGEKERISVQLVPVNPKNFLFDPNGTSIDECMGVAVEREISLHRVVEGIASGKYLNVDISSFNKDDSLEATQEKTQFQTDKVRLLTYYGLVPREYLSKDGEEIVEIPGISEDNEDYADMVEAIVVIANEGTLLKAEESPYMMKDRPIVSFQSDTVPNRLLGRGTVEKAFNMQSAIDGSARAHMDALALTVAPMIGMDATRLPRGAKFEVKPGKSFMTNGNPAEILFPFKFGTNDGQAMQTSKEFERMLLMATGTVDSAGQISQVSRDGNIDMATATLIKKYKRTLVNFQEDFLIPFIYKATWRYMQFDPARYPSVDVKFTPTATLGIIAREYEQKQLAFLIQTLGKDSPLTPVLMQGILRNSSLTDREQMIQQLQQASQPNPQAQQAQQMSVQMDMQTKQADAALKMAQAEKARVEASLAPEEVKAKIISALSNNLDDNNEGKDFERRARIADLMLREEDIRSNERIASLQAHTSLAKEKEKKKDQAYVDSVSNVMN